LKDHEARKRDAPLPPPPSSFFVLAVADLRSGPVAPSAGAVSHCSRDFFFSLSFPLPLLLATHAAVYPSLPLGMRSRSAPFPSPPAHWAVCPSGNGVKMEALEDEPFSPLPHLYANFMKGLTKRENVREESPLLFPFFTFSSLAEEGVMRGEK